jgi:hypothetical protein
MNTSEQINEIATALAKAQGEVENATKNAKNPHFKNDYADLAEVLATVRPVLSKHGIAVVQMTAIEGDAMVLHTRLIHTSGQWLESVHPVSKLPERPQTIGANETYARRYSLAAICGIAQADDDLGDGKKAAPASAPAPVDQEARRKMLIANGEQAAAFSMEALETWWKKNLSQADRDLVTMATLADLKKLVDQDLEAAQ